MRDLEEEVVTSSHPNPLPSPSPLTLTPALTLTLTLGLRHPQVRDLEDEIVTSLGSSSRQLAFSYARLNT